MMDTDQRPASATASRATEAPEVRGAGGKLRKPPPPRKLPTTPYARPPETSRGGRWISKFVDPAFRLITGGATRIMPSFLSTSSGLFGPISATENQGKWQAGERGYSDDDQGQPDDAHKSDSHLQGSKSIEMKDTSEPGGKLKRRSDVMCRQDQNGEQSEQNMLSAIERLVEGNTFSREEFNRLVELLNSRAVELANVEQGMEITNLTSRKDDEELVIAQGLPKVSIKRRREEPKGAIWGSSTPLGLSTVQDKIGASPIEIARAYMDSRATEAGPSSKSVIQAAERSVLCGDEAAIKPYDPSPSVKTSTCWPGVVVQDAYITPQSQRSRYGLHNFPRTPYSRTLLSKSKSRLTCLEGDYGNISSTPLSQSHTLYLQDKSKVDASETGYGSVGPIRRINRKVGAQSSSRSAYSLNGPSKGESSVVNEGFTPTVTKTSDPDGTYAHKQVGFEVGVPSVHMHTSLMAKRILEHIDRNIPTPVEKSAELNLATKWKSPESTVNVSSTLSIEYNDMLIIKDVSLSKYDGRDVRKSIPRNEGQGNCLVDILPGERTDKSIGVRKEGTSASVMNVCSSISTLGNDSRTLQNPIASQNFLKSTEEDGSKTLPGGRHPSIINQEKKPLSNSSASKPVLAPISIKKPVPGSRWTSASDNGSGFTFPVSTSSSVFSEPPTPSIMPLFSSVDPNQLKERSTELSYSFGSKRSNPAVVFSFPSTSNYAVHDDAGIIKFNFGSNEKARLSFSFEKKAVCC